VEKDSLVCVAEGADGATVADGAGGGVNCSILNSSGYFSATTFVLSMMTTAQVLYLAL